MEYKELGKSGIKISVIGIGTWQWGSREWGWNRTYRKKDVLEAFDRAIELGINFVDTAEMYGRGTSEKIIGEAIKAHRNEVVVATKVSPWNLSYGRVLKAAEHSLTRLGVDVIDLYQIHWPNRIIPIRNTMKAMKRLVNDGKVRLVGVSNFKLERFKAAKEAFAPLELASNQVRYNLLDRDIENNLLPYASTEKMSIIAYSPLAQGLLTGRYSLKDKPQSFVQKVNFRFSPRNLRRLTEFVRVLCEVAGAHGKTPSQAALNWLIGKENVIAIPGVKKADHVIDDIGAMDWRLTKDEVETLEKAAAHVRFDRLSSIPNLLRTVIPF